MSMTATDHAMVTIGGQEYVYLRRWRSQRFCPAEAFLVVDTETDVVDSRREIPTLALASASAGGKSHCLIHPDDLARFILAHKHLHIICHNAAFDFWVVENHLRIRGEEKARQAWWRVADQNRLHDSMLLDMLVRLARDDSYPSPRNLAEVAKHYAGLEISKDDPYRKRYGEIIGKDWVTVEDGFFHYAVKDAIVTRPAYLAMRKQAVALLEQFGRDSTDILPDARQKFGLLTEAVQVKKAIALAQITRNGITADLEWARKTECALREELLQAVAGAHAICPVYQVDEVGQFIFAGKTCAPAFQDKDLRDQLALIKKQIEQENSLPVNIPLTKKGISRSGKVWSDWAHLYPFLGYWVKAQGLTKLLQFFTAFQEQVDVGALADALQVDVQDQAEALKVKFGEDEVLLIKVGNLPLVARAKNRKLKQLGLKPEQVLAQAQALAAANRQSHCTLHPSYSVMVRTGRTSCSSPNIQQIPKSSDFRQTFTASPGYFLLAVDYSFIELLTFAATALRRYGWSDMADVIKKGVDPHAHTAAMMLNVPLAEFLTWKDNEAVAEKKIVDGKEVVIKFKDKYDQARQAAKPVNFGVPGGLGVASLVCRQSSIDG